MKVLTKYAKDVLTGLLCGAIIAGFIIFVLSHPPRPHGGATRIVTLKGDKVVRVENFSKFDGRFIFIFSRQGVFYFDTTVGQVFKLEDMKFLGKGHQKMVTETLFDMARMYDGEDA